MPTILFRHEPDVSSQDVMNVAVFAEYVGNQCFERLAKCFSSRERKMGDVLGQSGRKRPTCQADCRPGGSYNIQWIWRSASRRGRSAQRDKKIGDFGGSRLNRTWPLFAAPKERFVLA